MKRFFTASLCALFLAAPAAAATLTVNPNFQTGDLSGWQTIGSTGVGTYSGSFNNTFQGIINSSNGVFFTNLDPFAHASLGSTGGAFGSAIRTQVTVGAGDFVLFDWSISSSELLATDPINSFPDFGFTAANGIVHKFGITTFQGNLANYTDQTGFVYFPTAGTFDLTIGAMNYQDNQGPTTLYVDNLRIATPAEAALLPIVPLPPAIWAGMALFAASAGIIRWRRTPLRPV